MPDYLHPGVYVEETNAGPRPIDGVDTSTAGFVGPTERGPLPPRLISSWQEYCRWYGGHLDRASCHTKYIYMSHAVRGFFENGGRRLYVARAPRPNSGTAMAHLSTGVITAVGPGAWGSNILFRISPASLACENTPDADRFRLTVLYYRDGIPDRFVDPTDVALFDSDGRVEPEVIEDFDNLSADETNTSFAQTVVNKGSRLVSITVNGRPEDTNFMDLPMSQVSDGDEPGADQYRGSEDDPMERRTGLLGLSAISGISLLVIPDDVLIPDLRNDLLDQCEMLKDRFAILSATEQEQDGNLETLRPPRESAYGAYYLPWARVRAHADNDVRLVPLAGHIAGIYARVDMERGVHKPPANEEVRGIIASELGPEPLKHTLNKQQSDLLSAKGVNVIRDFRHEGRGIRVWGARTMSSDPVWKYVNIRRLLMFVEQSIDQGTQWVAFEPNNESTWKVIRWSIATFLQALWRSGAVVGMKQEESYFVKCDRTTMTQDDIDNGRLVCLVGIAPIKPSEFVIIRISQKSLEAQGE